MKNDFPASLRSSNGGWRALLFPKSLLSTQTNLFRRFSFGVIKKIRKEMSSFPIESAMKRSKTCLPNIICLEAPCSQNYMTSKIMFLLSLPFHLKGNSSNSTNT